MKVPLGLIVVAFAIFAVNFWSLNQHKWTPLSTPLSLKIGEFTSPVFSVDLDSPYSVEIVVDRIMPFDRLACLLGARPSRPDQCDGIPSALDLSYSVYEQNGRHCEVQSGEGIGSWGPAVARLVGSFDGRNGRSYYIVTKLARDASILSAASPRLVVTEGSHAYKGRVAIAQILALPAFLFLAIGVVWIVALAAIRLFRSERRQNA